MANIGNEENHIFSIIEIFIKKNHKQYVLNSIRINSLVRIFNGVTPEILLNLLKNAGKNTEEGDSKIYACSNTTDVQKVLCFISKDIVTVKFHNTPDITLARYFFQFDECHIILCNCCYKESYNLNTFDLIFYIQNQDFGRSNESHNSKMTLISGSSGKSFTNKCMVPFGSVLTNYGTIYLIYSLFAWLVYILIAIKRYLSTKVSEEEIEKLFIKNYISNLDIQTCKKGNI
ncbi:putative transmembrane domain-containing protein [Cryptosporidium parvum]